MRDMLTFVLCQFLSLPSCVSVLCASPPLSISFSFFLCFYSLCTVSCQSSSREEPRSKQIALLPPTNIFTQKFTARYTLISRTVSRCFNPHSTLLPCLHPRGIDAGYTGCHLRIRAFGFRTFPPRAFLSKLCVLVSFSEILFRSLSLFLPLSFAWLAHQVDSLANSRARFRL